MGFVLVLTIDPSPKTVLARALWVFCSQEGVANVQITDWAIYQYCNTTLLDYYSSFFKVVQSELLSINDERGQKDIPSLAFQIIYQ